jgi:hypothetical protein
MALWEKALSSELPSPEPSPEGQPLFLGPEEPITAPTAEDQTASPTRSEARDGFVPRPEDALRAALEENATSVLKADVAAQPPAAKQRRPARRVFWFGRAVDSGDSPAGTLYALGEAGQLVELSGHVKATRVVEVIEAEGGPTSAKTETLTCEVSGGRARWSRQNG